MTGDTHPACDPALLRQTIGVLQAAHSLAQHDLTEHRNQWADLHQRASKETLAGACVALAVVCLLGLILYRVVSAVLFVLFPVPSVHQDDDDDEGEGEEERASDPAFHAARAAEVVDRRGVVSCGAETVIRANTAFAFAWRFVVFVACYGTMAYVSFMISFDDSRDSGPTLHQGTADDSFLTRFVAKAQYAAQLASHILGISKLFMQVLGLVGLYVWVPVLGFVADRLLHIDSDLDTIRSECGSSARATSAVALMLAAGVSEDDAVASVRADPVLFPPDAVAAGTLTVDAEFSMETLVGAAYANGRDRLLSEGRAASPPPQQIAAGASPSRRLFHDAPGSSSSSQSSAAAVATVDQRPSPVPQNPADDEAVPPSKPVSGKNKSGRGRRKTERR